MTRSGISSSSAWRAVWVTRSFLDYRVPVYEELDSLLGEALVLIYNADVVPERVRNKAAAALGSRAIGLTGEWRLGHKSYLNRAANSGLRVPWQPGLMREMRRHQPSVVITDGFFQWTSAAIWLRMLQGVPHVLCYERTAHMERGAQWYRRLYRKWALRYIDAMCCSGSLSGNYACHMGMPPDRITYGHMAADTEGMIAARRKIVPQDISDLRWRLSLKGTCLLYVGRLTREKGLRQLLGAWAEMKPGLNQNASLLLVGSGPDRDFLENTCKVQGLNNVRFTGAIDYDDLALFYAVASAFVIPTLEDNWSLVVPEALACGLPVLCSKYNGCWPELVQEGRNGWVFDPLDPVDTVRCLEECVRSEMKLTSMGSESTRLIRDYTPRKAAESVLKACELAMRVGVRGKAR